jgi:Cu2+-containing amine oxidase|tara:strand:+ start:516 stop:803 length:288 start_codon:yes stop_codon:yes gene_type:complete
MAWENLDENRLKQIIRQASGKVSKKDEHLVVPSIIKCIGVKWYYAPSKRRHMRTRCGLKVHIVDYEEDEEGRVLVYDGYLLIAVPLGDLETIGFN